MRITDNDIKVNSWCELCDKLYIDSWKPELERYRTDYAFRGLSDNHYQLKNSFTRNCSNNEHLEYHILRAFRKYGQFRDPLVSMSEWRLVTIAQHYGVPTRLIDWTYSPFVAAHFATFDTTKYDKDGVIWMVDFKKVNQLLPEQLLGVLKKVGANTFTIEILEEALTGLKDYDALNPGKLLAFFEPPSIDHRIVNQFAFSSVMSSATAVMDDWLVQHPELFKRIIIPKKLKWEVRDKLDQANITERILFPGLDGLADWLRRHYKPKNC
jgi:hypothetical protein